MHSSSRHRRTRAAGAATGLAEALESLRKATLSSRRVESDPIRIVLDYPEPADQEVAGLLAALLAYGRVELLQAHIREVLAPLGIHPAARLRRGVPALPDLAYRFHRSEDLAALLGGIRTMLRRHGNLGLAFHAHLQSTGALRPSLTGFVDELRTAAGPAGPGLRFLLADPALGGACKRWQLYLRWMVRWAEGDPDRGVWRDLVPASILLIPLDTHLVRVSRRLGLTKRKTVDWRMAEEVTSVLRDLRPEDPIRYDFPLCHLGMAGVCPPKLEAETCTRCPLQRVCPVGRRWTGRLERSRPRS
jgi:uncharacterized protein (TIGR02757 family)